MELIKYQTSVSEEVERSKMKPAPYNPRTISSKARQLIKNNLKTKGLMGGIVWNKTTGNLVAGHQKISVIDELLGYPDKVNDYLIRVEVVELSLKEEKEQNIFMNNKNAQGEYQDSLLKAMMLDTEIDPKAAGMDEIDMAYLGISMNKDATEVINGVQNDFNELMQPVEAVNNAKKEHVKKVKAEVAAAAKETSEDGEAFFMISFDNYQNKVEFMDRFGFEPTERYIKGEDFSEMIERID